MVGTIDRIIGVFSPATAVRRIHARRVMEIMASGYSEGGASRNKNSMKGWKWQGGSTREDIEVPLPILRQRSRDLYMNGGIARAALNRIQTNVVGQGLRLHVAPDAEILGMDREQAAQWSRTVEREWKLLTGSNEVDQTGLNDFFELQQITLLSWLMSGDVFAILPEGVPTFECPYSLRVHLIEADRVCTPSSVPKGVTIRDGVEIDKTGRVVAYHVKNSHPLSTANTDADAGKHVRIPARGGLSGRRNILHMITCERTEQYRGVPFLAPVIEDCKQLARYAEAELMAAVVASMYTVFIKSETPDTPFGESCSADLADSTDPERDYNYNLGPGAIVALNPNEDITTANPGRPNAQFDAFIGAISREIGAALNVPSELLLLQFTKSYSASRAALLEAWKGFRMWRAWVANDFCQPVYEEWLTEAILRGRVQAPGFFEDPLTRMAWCGAEWHGPAPGQVDPIREVQAAALRVSECFSTRARETAELTGGDYEANVRERAQEERRRLELGLVSDQAAAGFEPGDDQDADEDEDESGSARNGGTNE